MTLPVIYSEKRKSGIKLIGTIPWGSDFCQFYETQEDLEEMLLPYFRAGLADNELCLWIIPNTLDPDQAAIVLKRKLRQFDRYQKKGQIEIIPHNRWRTMGEASGKAVVSVLDRAVSRGFEGLRLACHAVHGGKFKGQSGHHPAAEFIAPYNAIGLFAYPRNRFDATGLMAVVDQHQYALVKNGGQWEVIESSGARTATDALKRSERKLQLLFHNMSEAFAYHRAVLDESGNPSNYVFLEVNEAFERLTGLSAKTILGRRATDVLPGIESDPADWIGKYGTVALTGKPIQFESYSEQLKRWYSVSAFSTFKGFFAVTFSDITERKRADREVRNHSAVVEGINRVLSAALTSQTEEELGATCLNIVEQLTQSRFGFIGEINEQGLEDIAISNPGWDACKILDPFGHRRPPGNFKIHGLYGRVLLDGKTLFTNDPSHHPDCIGLPPGHPPLEAFIGAPLIHEGRTIGILAMGNRPGGYGDAEQLMMESLAPAIVEAFMRRRAETQLRKAHDQLDQKVRERTEELRKVNRTLQMTSECNQILVRATEETELIREVCRIIVEMGGYLMSWVGYAENDEEKTIRPVVSIGSHQDYLKNAKMSWADTPHGRGPAGTCIRTGRMQHGRSFLAAPELKPWRELAFEYGIQSSIGLPLMSGEKAFGVLGIYSDIPDAFEESEALLRELADDLAFGIVNLRARTERDQARQAAEKRAGQLQALAVELVQAEQKERRQLARVLHDHLQQILVGAKFGASLIRAKAKNNLEIAQTAEELTGTIDEAIRASRSLSANLSPPVLHEKGLAAGLKWLGRQMLEKHGLTVTVEADESAEPETEQVRQFLFESVRELLLNASKYAQTDRVDVEMRMLETGEVNITVSDRGIGFDPKSAEAPASTVGGFGLFSIRERLSYLRGKLLIDSAPGRGSRFTLLAPARLMPHTPEGEQSAAAEPLIGSRHFVASTGDGAIAGKISVLLADDHPVLRHGLIRLLEEQTDIHVVGEAGDGPEAIELARRLNPDIVIMDIGLPSLSGFEATRRIVSECPETRVIGLSMHKEPEMRAAMLEVGAAAYLTKGGPIEDLIATIRSCRPEKPPVSNPA